MIELKEFTKKFGAVTAVDAVSFQVEAGSIFGLVGSNGAGKSTLLRSICGVYAPDGGQVLLDGEAPYENPEAKGKVFFVSDYPYFMNQFALKDMADFFRHIYPNWSEEEYARLQKIFPRGCSARRPSPAPWPPCRNTCSWTRCSTAWTRSCASC